MPERTRFTLLPAAALVALVGTSVSAALPKKPAAAPAAARKAPAPDFNAEVRPILARHCFKCHGPDDGQRQAKLRLDQRDGAIGAAASGKHAVVPGKPEQSEMLRRVTMADGGVMPPVATKNPVTAEERAILQRWIAAGAEYRLHWAFVPPKPAPLPAVKQKGWPRNGIDYFVLAKLEASGLKPAPEADRMTLVRRVYLDLIGIPPTPEEADAFINDSAPDAYEKVVDKLLASPHYGERWARKWLDLARYADTNGYEKDRYRSIWPYRDWVINALNQDMPFDEFTIEQLAGDMLPNATPEQRIATGFHRNTMLNEEGGIDPLEFRFHAMTDRVLTTGATWLGLTIGCAQCHTHKYDPISHREYYQIMACLDNTEEPEYFIPKPEITAKRAEIEKKIQAIQSDLANRFPPAGEMKWTPAHPETVKAKSGAKVETLPDDSVRVSGENPDKDSYTLEFQGLPANVSAIRLEALTDPSLGNGGPGRTPHGNFVLTEISAASGGASAQQPVKFNRAEADFSQEQFPPLNAVDGNQKTGWAIQGPGTWNVNRTATFYTAKPIEGRRWSVTLDQQYGSQHTLGHFRLSFGVMQSDGRPLEVRQRENLEQRFAAWDKAESAKAVHWVIAKPSGLKTNLPKLTVQPDGSILAGGDMTKRDVYDLSFKPEQKGIRALRLEVLPDPSLPRNGPGRVFYEGAFGDFHLSEITMSAGGKPVQIKGASQTAGAPAANALDGNPETGWSINGAQGKTSAAVFNLAQPLADGGDVAVEMVFERYFAAALGRFRISFTTDDGAEARHPGEIETLLTKPRDQRSAADTAKLRDYYLSVAPELAPEREAIDKLQGQMPEYPPTLVFRERPADNPRQTFIHKRGEFLQPTEAVQPGVLAVLNPMPADAPKNRLAFARWLVDPKNPLVARVAVNRQWAAIFGRGIVKTTEDFGLQGELPSHPELLDYLACAFTASPASGEKLGWSWKRLHRLIVTSATYRQSSRVTPELLAKDPLNRLLSRGPRFRMDAELIRDSALREAGLLSEKLGGPSVFPPQPANVTSEGAYGALQWKVSEGEDRYRRGLYTFSKRTAPYAQFITFDAPSGEACVARRDVSNTPLQALTLMNDAVFVEANQALGKMVAARSGSPEERATYLFRRILTRNPTAEELAAIIRFYRTQKSRLDAKSLNAAVIAGAGEGDAGERAAWTLVARSVMNLDEAIVKE